MVDLHVDLRHPPIVYLTEKAAPERGTLRTVVESAGRGAARRRPMLRSHIAHYPVPLEPGRHRGCRVRPSAKLGLTQSD